MPQSEQSLELVNQSKMKTLSLADQQSVGVFFFFILYVVVEFSEKHTC